MSAGIIKGVDAGCVGNCETFGHTWHGFEEYIEFPGLVPVADVRKALCYEVVKVPTKWNVTDPILSAALPNCDGRATGQFALVRTDKAVQVWTNSVSSEYTIFQNSEFINHLENTLLQPVTIDGQKKQLGIESCGTLFGGRYAFVNILLDTYRVRKDDSETATRLFYYNAFGGKSLTAGAHDTRIVCANTLNLAESQALANATLKKFQHTKGASAKVGEYVVDLTKLMDNMRKHRAILDNLTDMQMNTVDVNNFLGTLFPISGEAGQSTVTRRENKRNDILNRFETLPDLQGSIARTRYAMLQAVTNYSQHGTTTKGTDAAYAWWNVATGGNRDDLNQEALKILANPEIPSVKSEAVLVLN